ncbi:MAG: RdgB/HAM1 family non-canonical purine NTP pyrophosphatase [Alistipes sp.]|nr:RdgB/HAM1 family non-canonical purine NTP pyrophosphatase [Alistipes sp.]
MKIVFATNNAHKLSEVKAVLGDGFELVTLKEVGITEDIPETGETLDENASIKARYVYERTGLDCFADDTGLEVAALNSAPGVRSARYATDGHDFAANNRKLLRELEGVADRSARFRTVISLIINGEEQQVEGIVRGTIATEESGCEGFGYDPLFIPEGKSVTFAEMSADEKNAISHRGRAVAELVKILKKIESLYF